MCVLQYSVSLVWCGGIQCVCLCVVVWCSVCNVCVCGVCVPLTSTHMAYYRADPVQKSNTWMT